MYATQQRPSYKQGFARSAAESSYPWLWRGMQIGWASALGITGTFIPDLSGHRRDLSVNLSAHTWRPGKINAVATEDCASFTALPSMSTWTVVSHCETVTGTFYNGLFGNDTDTANAIGWRGSIGEQAVRGSNYTSNAYDWGGASDVEGRGLESWSWRFEDATRCRLGRDAEFNDTATPSNSFNWTIVNRLYESSTNVGQETNWATILVFDRWLADRELSLLAIDPLAPFRRKRRTVGYVPSGGGGATAFPFNLYYEGAGSL